MDWLGNTENCSKRKWMCFINAFLILLLHESKEITMGKHVAWMGK